MKLRASVSFLVLLLSVALAGCDSSRPKRIMGTWIGSYEGVSIEITITQGATSDSYRPDLLFIKTGNSSYYFNGVFEADQFVGGSAVPLTRAGIGTRPYVLVSKIESGDLLGENLTEARLPKNLVFHPKK
ncbi:MAG: hypothetical protein PSW75_12290 [bacterium]|nr:hypothetical protein [bacterium]MDI1335389.1 hypothetical protein [Lacunisphaera sp.]